MQLMAHTLCGKVASATTREYGETNVSSAHFGESSPYTLAGPPVNIIPLGFFSFIFSIEILNGTTSEYILFFVYLIKYLYYKIKGGFYGIKRINFNIRLWRTI